MAALAGSVALPDKAKQASARGWAFGLLGAHPKNMKSRVYAATCTRVFMTASFITFPNNQAPETPLGG